MEGCLEVPDLHGGQRYSLHPDAWGRTEQCSVSIGWPRLVLQVLIRREGGMLWKVVWGADLCKYAPRGGDKEL